MLRFHSCLSLLAQCRFSPRTPNYSSVGMWPMSNTLTYSSSPTCCSSASDLPGETNTWNLILDLSFYKIGDILMAFELNWNSDFGDVPVLDAVGASTPLRGTAGLQVYSGTVTESFVGRLIGSLNADMFGPCAPVVNSFSGEMVSRARRVTSPNCPLLNQARGSLC